MFRGSKIQVFLLLGALCFQALGADRNATLRTSGQKASGTRGWSLGFQYGYLSAPQMALASNPSAGSADRMHSGRISFSFSPLRSVGVLDLGTAVGFFQSKRLDGREMLFSIPLEAYLMVRGRIFPKQILVPVGRLGMTWAPTRGTHSAGTRLARGWDYTFGLHVLLNVFDPRGSKALSNNSSVQSTYLTVEYTKMNSMGTPAAGLNLSGDVYRAGLMMEF